MKLDALIVGAGPTGLAAAILLTEAGWRVRVLDERRGVGEHSRAIGIHPPGLAVLDRLGVGEAARNQGVKIRDGAGLSRNRVIGALDFSVIGGAHRYVLSLPQNQTVTLLRQRLHELDRHALQEGTGYLGHSQDGQGDLSITVRQENAPGAPGAAQQLRSRWLIGADGTNSAVRRALNLQVSGRALPDTYTMGDYPDTTGYGPSAALFLHPHGIIESFPLPQHRRRWVAHVGRHAALEGPWDLPRIVHERTGWRLEEHACTMRSTFCTANRRVPGMVHGRTVLIGDAAHEVSPIGGQGMTLGLGDAQQLARLLTTGATTQQLNHFSSMRLRAARRAGYQAHLNMLLGRPLPTALVPVRDRLFTALAANDRFRTAVARTFTMRWAQGTGTPGR